MTIEQDRSEDLSFDHHDPALARNPFPVYQRLRDRCPVGRNEAWGGFWTVSRYADVVRAAKDDDTFRSGVVLPDGAIQGVTIPAVGQARPLIPIEVDPPEFLKYRRLLNPPYSPTSVARRESELRVLASDLVDRFIEKGECDLVDALTAPLPAIVTLRDIGLPEDRWREFLDWVQIGVHAASHDLDRAVEALMEVAAELAEAIDARREGRAQGGLIGYFLESTVDDRPVTDEEIMDMCHLLLFGGLDTTSGAAATAFWYLAEHPEQRAQLVDDPSLVPLAVEEFLRYVTPVQNLARTVSRDTELGGQIMRAGDRVLLMWGSANHDEAEFPEPEEIVLDREENRHLAFGVGIHRCLGSNIGRAMFRLMLEEVLLRLPDYRIAPGAEVTWFEDISSVYGVTSLPIEFAPGERRS